MYNAFKCVIVLGLLGRLLMQTQDALVAAEAGVDGILLSNHGGALGLATRHLFDTQFPSSRSTIGLVSVKDFVGGSHSSFDSTLPPMEVLYKLRQHHPEIFDKMEGMALYISLLL